MKISRPSWTEDHPRGCGEHMPAANIQARIMGSSPRMRGAPWWFFASISWTWIIPADAGSTLRNPCNPNNIIDKISNF